MLSSLNIPDYLFENIKKISVDVNWDSINLINNDSALTEDEVRSCLEEFDDEVATNSSSIWEQLNSLALKILDSSKTLREKKPFIFLLFQVLIFIISSNVYPIIEDELKEKVLYQFQSSEDNPKKTVIVLKEELSSFDEFNYASFFINKVRITSSETPVFNSDRRKSGRIGVIQPNKPVLILKKKKNWCYVMYTNNEQEELVGWVNTKNLLK